jgi:hypothetical protein
VFIVALMVTALLYLQQRRWWRAAFVVGLTLGGGRRAQEDVVCWVRCGLYYRQRRWLRVAMYIVASMVTALL